MVTVIIWSYVIAGLVTAVLWLKAATVKVTKSSKSDSAEFQDAEIWVNGVNYLETTKVQAKWNSCAAFASVVTAVLQILVTVTQDGN